jgi:hypothetical protein
MARRGQSPFGDTDGGISVDTDLELSVEADLDLTVDGHDCSVWTEDGTVVVEAPSLTAARSLLSGVDALPVDPNRLAAGLAGGSITVRVQVRRATVARVGAGVDPSPLADSLGYEADVSPRGIAVAAWRWLG